MQEVILIKGAGSGFGELAAKALATAGHIVSASMRSLKGNSEQKVTEYAQFAKEKNVELHSVELDTNSVESAEAAVQHVVTDHGRLDVVIHNAGHMSFGPLEAYTPEQIASLYNDNVVGTQRVNRAALPVMRKQRNGLLIWNSSSSAAGGTPPYLGPYFAAKAALDALAVAYARELTRWGIKTSIVVPGAFTKGTNHFANAENRPMRQSPMNMKRGRTKALGKRSRLPSIPSFRRMRTYPPWRMPWSRSLPHPEEGVLSAFPWMPPTMDQWL